MKYFNKKICNQCGKVFECVADVYGYKVKRKDGVKIFCCYSCYNAFLKEIEAEKKERIKTHFEKKETQQVSSTTLAHRVKTRLLKEKDLEF